MPATRSLRDVLTDITNLAVEYYELTGRPLGVTGEIAECTACATFDMELAPARSAGFDAIHARDGGMRKVQIKGRWKKDGKKWGRVPRIDIAKDFDTVMLVLMHKRYEPFEIWEAPREKVIARLSHRGSKSRNERGSMDVSQFKSIAERVWPV